MAIVIKEIIVKATVVEGRKDKIMEIPDDWMRRLREELMREMEQWRLPDRDKRGGRIWKR